LWFFHSDLNDLLAVSFYLLKKDIVRVTHTAKHNDLVLETGQIIVAAGGKRM
jgi:hypothetical protein